jgi:acetyltransferase-like isoleucine patch superfamily enzyme
MSATPSQWHDNVVIHPAAIVSTSAQIGAGTRIGPFTVVHDHVVIGEHCIIDGHCEIGYPTPLANGKPLIIGDRAIIRSHTVLYAGSVFGSGLKTGHHSVARENVVAGEGFQLGTHAELQGDCQIGDHTRTQTCVLIGKGTRIGSFVWIYPYAGIANDPHPPSDVCRPATVEDYAVIAVNSVVLAGVTLGAHCLVAAQSCVHSDVPPGTVVSGDPARVRCKTSAIRFSDSSGRAAYPWPRHFHRGYPQDVIDRWSEEFGPF